MIKQERDKIRLAHLKNAEVNLSQARKSLGSDPSSSNFLLGSALRVIESNLPEESTEKRRYYLVEAINRFELAKSRSDAAVLESRLKTLPPPPVVEATKSPFKVTAQEGVQQFIEDVRKKSEESKPTKPTYRNPMIESGTKDQWLKTIRDAAESRGVITLGSLVSEDYQREGYKSFLIAALGSRIDKRKLLSIVKGADKVTIRNIELLGDLGEKKEIVCDVTSSDRQYAVDLLDLISEVPAAKVDGKRRWEFHLPDASPIAVLMEAETSQETGRPKRYVFRAITGA